MKQILAALSLVILVASPLAQAAERLRVQVPTQSEQRVQALLENLATAIDNEDHEAYSVCFTKKARARYCEQAALDFVTYDMSMELGRWVLLEDSDGSATIVLKYTLARGAATTEYVSKVHAVECDGHLRIDKEDVRSTRQVGGSAVPEEPAADPKMVCRNGKCDLREPARPRQRVIPALFNDANGNPDPNGIMWLDPDKLIGEECVPCRRRAR